MGEFLVARDGLGFLIVYGGQVAQLDTVMMSIVILSAILTLPITFAPTPNLTLSPIIGLSNVYPLFPIQLDPCNFKFFPICDIPFTTILPA